MGARVYGLGVMALGMVCLVGGDFVLGQPVPGGFPGRTVLAYLVGAFLLAGGAAATWPRTAARGAAALVAYYVVVVVLLMNGRVALTHFAEFGTYSGIAEQLSIAAGGLLVYASTAKVFATSRALLTRLGQRAFGVCALFFGGAHFVYMNLTAPLVPRWLPPSPGFWAVATGTGFLAAGVALLTGVQARLAATLLTVMLASFTLVVHTPMILAGPSSRMNWTEGAVNLAVTGAAWVVADSLRGRQGASRA